MASPVVLLIVPLISSVKFENLSRCLNETYSLQSVDLCYSEQTSTL
jgi:hypothetical protein